MPRRAATLVLLAHAALASGSSDFAAGVRNMSQVAAAEAIDPPVEAVSDFWRLVGDVSSTTPSTSTLTIRREDSTSIPCTDTHHYLYVRKSLGDEALLAHSDGGSSLTLLVDADLASVQAFLQCGKDTAYNEIDVAALREEFIAAGGPSLGGIRRGLLPALEAKHKETAENAEDDLRVLVNALKGMLDVPILQKYANHSHRARLHQSQFRPRHRPRR